MNDSPQPEQTESNEEFREQRRSKRNPSDDQATLSKKTAVTNTSVRDPCIRPQIKLLTWNFFALLRTNMELEDSKEKSNNRTDGEQHEPTNQAGRPPPTNLTSATNLIQLQKQLKGIVKGSFEFRSTRNGTRIVPKEMINFFPKSRKPVKAVIGHLPFITQAEEIYEALVELDLM
jgi:hypothetical protein